MNARCFKTLVSRIIASAASLTISIAAIAQDAQQNESPGNTAGASSGAEGNLNLDMNLEDLSRQDVRVPGLSTEVSTVERQVSTIARTPSAVFVITQEMIKRSGARHIPDVLRMAPGVDVAKISSDIWAISIRGFNDRLANKLLVQIDGRIVYTPQFGVDGRDET